MAQKTLRHESESAGDDQPAEEDALHRPAMGGDPAFDGEMEPASCGEDSIGGHRDGLFPSGAGLTLMGTIQ